MLSGSVMLCALLATLSEPPAARSIAEFSPSAHGFAFVNAFDGNPLGRTGLPALDRLATGAVNGRFGLCGGMSFAAADLFLARRARPEATITPREGSAWFAYLRRRQVDSLGPGLGIVQQFARAMTAPDRGPAGLQVSTCIAMQDIARDLNAGRPVVLGLVFSGGTHGGKLWENHQVLALAARPEPGALTIRIYDPNYPNRDDVAVNARLVISGWMPGVLSIAPTPMVGVQCARTLRQRVHPLRGFFAIPYTPVQPDAALSPDVRP